VLRSRLQKLADRLAEAIGPIGYRVFTDSAPVLEVELATRSGIGWRGKHTLALDRDAGSMFFLGEIFVDVALPETPVVSDHCGSCSACIDVCPTQAIVAPYELDARRCISYLTIEHRGAIPRELRPLVGDWVFGCDVCQEVCPWNRFAPEGREARLHARSLEGWSLTRFLELDDTAFLELFAGSPIRRALRGGFLRNVCVALGNRRETGAVPALTRTLEHEADPLVRAHAAWALGEIARAGGDTTTVREALRRAAVDADPDVREEAIAALAAVAG
jgi:epoxyqueuosine reductase